MDYSSLILVFLLYAVLTLSSSTFLPKLRRYKITTAVGRFAVPRDKLQRVIEDRMGEDNQCGNCEYCHNVYFNRIMSFQSNLLSLY